MISRRVFLATTCRQSSIVGAGMVFPRGALGFFSGDQSGLAIAGNYADDLFLKAPRARWWQSLRKDNAVRCFLCPHACVIGDGARGTWNTHVNVKGELKGLVYGRPVSIHVDPIEKKPLSSPSGRRGILDGDRRLPAQTQMLSELGNLQAWPEDFRVSYANPRGSPVLHMTAKPAS